MSHFGLSRGSPRGQVKGHEHVRCIFYGEVWEPVRPEAGLAAHRQDSYLALRHALCALRARWTPIAKKPRSEEHTSELQSLMRISYAVFCLKKTNQRNTNKM